MSVIRDMDLMLQSANVTDICFDVNYYKNKNIGIDKSTLIDHLKESIKTKGLSFHEDDKTSEQEVEYVNTSSTFELDKGKDYVLCIELPNRVVKCDELESLEWDVKSPGSDIGLCHRLSALGLETIAFEDVKINIGMLGEAVFTSTVRFRDHSMSVKDYDLIADICRKTCRLFYKDTVADICCSYVRTVSKLAKSDKDAYKLLQIGLGDFNTVEDKCDYVTRRSLYALSWLHIVYDQRMMEEGIDELLNEIMTDEDERSNVLKLEFSKFLVLVGWSHSFIITGELEEHKRKKIVNFYRLPFEFGWGEYEFMEKLIYNTDRLIDDTYSIFESKAKRNKVSKYKRTIDKLYFFMNRAMDSYESSSITLNRTQVKLMSLINKQWEINLQHQRYKSKMTSLKELVQYVANLQNTSRSRLLNGILFLIALLSTVDISNTIYQMFSNGLEEQLLFSTAPISTIFVIMFLYIRLSSK